MSDGGLLISVVVCTYNRVDWLNNALTSLCNQDFPVTDYEILVVDNNSSDGTKALVEDFMGKHANIRYFLEEKQGVSHTRTRGCMEAFGEYIGCIDDDAKAPPEWLAVAKTIIKTRRPAAFGGPYYAFYLTPKPDWFKDEYESRTPIPEARNLVGDEALYGANLFVRNDVIRAVGGFDPSLGMTGNTIGYGEEPAMIRMVRKVFPDEHVYYDPKLFVYHLVRPHKMKVSWYLRERFVGGRDMYRVMTKRKRVAKIQLLKNISKTLFMLLKQIVQAICFRDRARYPFYQNHLYDHAFKSLLLLGGQYEQLCEWKYMKGKE